MCRHSYCLYVSLYSAVRTWKTEKTVKKIADVTDSTPASAKTNYHIAKEKIIRYMNNHD